MGYTTNFGFYNWRLEIFESRKSTLA